MSFNPSKCNVIHVTKKKKPILHTYMLKGETLAVVDTATYLGVSISKDLRWQSQVSKVSSKANRTLSFIVTSVPSIKEKAYKTIVRRTQDYAATVWDPH